ncbi:MAG: hypothetical protein AAGD05_03610 [Bacteroidota bacterium]
MGQSSVPRKEAPVSSIAVGPDHLRPNQALGGQTVASAQGFEVFGHIKQSNFHRLGKLLLLDINGSEYPISLNANDPDNGQSAQNNNASNDVIFQISLN